MLMSCEHSSLTPSPSTQLSLMTSTITLLQSMLKSASSRAIKSQIRATCMWLHVPFSVLFDYHKLWPRWTLEMWSLCMMSMSHSSWWTSHSVACAVSLAITINASRLAARSADRTSRPILCNKCVKSVKPVMKCCLLMRYLSACKRDNQCVKTRMSWILCLTTIKTCQFCTSTKTKR